MPDPDTPTLWLPDGSRAPIGNAPPEEGGIVDAEIVHDDPGLAAAAATGHALVPHAQPSATSTALFDAASPNDLIAQATQVATALDAVVAAQGLRTNMGTRDKPRWHVDVEGWQTLGTLLGCVAELEYARPWTDPATGQPDRVKYTARVEHFVGRGNQRRLDKITTYDVDGYSWEARVQIVRNGVTVGIGEALCSRKEVRWGRADDYAVKSMAITRATSRAYKQAAGWVVALAGYSATPSAEVDPMTGSVLPYGPDADGLTIERLRRALTYLFDADAGPTGDELLYEAGQDWMTAVFGEASGHLPQVVARAVLLLARDVKKYRQTDDTPTPEDPTND